MGELAAAMRVAPPVVLSPEEAARLRQWRGGRRGDPERARRAAIVLFAAAGLEDIEIARLTRTHRLTVARWRKRFLARRLQGLVSPGSGLRTGSIPAERVESIVRQTVGARPPGGRRWSTRSLAAAHGVSHATVHRLWRLHGVRPPRWDTLPRRADPVMPLAPWDVVGVALHRDAAALALTLHPIPVGERLERSTGPAAEERSPRRPEGSGPPIPPRAPDVAPVIRFLGTLTAQLPTGVPVHVVASPPPNGATVSLRGWRVRHPNVHLEFVADLADWRVRALALVRAAARSAHPADRHRGPAEAGGALARTLEDFRPDSGPYEWVASPREIAAGEAVYRLRHDLAVTGHPGFKPRAPVSGSMPRSVSEEERARAMARSIVRRYLKVAPGERVTVDTWTATAAEANAIVLEALRVGARPLLLYQDEATYWAAATEVSSRNLSHIGEHRKAALERTDVLVSFFGPSDRERFHALPPALRDRLCGAEDETYRAAARAGARGVSLALGRVSPASARMYGVELDSWRTELVDASLVDPKVLAERGKRLARRLAKGKELEVRHANGTSLRLRLAGAPPVVADGVVRPAKRADDWDLVIVPAGVVQVALDDRFAEGTFRSNVAASTGISEGVGEMAGGRWSFEQGRLVRFRYDAGEEVFRQSYERAPSGRDRPASLSIGLNERIEHAVLLEDQGLGTVTMHIGRNDHLGGKNHVPWWAWIFQRGGDVLVDGAPVVRGGALVP